MGGACVGIEGGFLNPSLSFLIVNSGRPAR